MERIASGHAAQVGGGRVGLEEAGGVCGDGAARVHERELDKHARRELEEPARRVAVLAQLGNAERFEHAAEELRGRETAAEGGAHAAQSEHLGGRPVDTERQRRVKQHAPRCPYQWVAPWVEPQDRRGQRPATVKGIAAGPLARLPPGCRAQTGKDSRAHATPIVRDLAPCGLPLQRGDLIGNLLRDRGRALVLLVRLILALERLLGRLFGLPHPN